MAQGDYVEKLKDPRWQKKRLEILERDHWECQECCETSKTLHVHHRWYEKRRDPWNYPDSCFITLCEECHEREKEDRKRIENEVLELLRGIMLYPQLEEFSETLRNMPDVRSLGWRDIGFAETLGFICRPGNELFRRLAIGVQLSYDASSDILDAILSEIDGLWDSYEQFCSEMMKERVDKKEEWVLRQEFLRSWIEKKSTKPT